MAVLEIPTAEWFIPFLEPARYKLGWGGRGSSKSHSFAEALIERCLMKKTDAVCVREIQKSLQQSVKKLLELKIESLGVGSYFEVQDAKIKAPYGGTIIFQGMQNHTADSIKSLEGFDICWCEEAQTLSQYSLDLLRPTIRKPDSELWFTMNPKNPTDPIDKLLRGKHPPKDCIIARVNYTDNPWFPQVLKDEMEYDRARDYDKYLHVWEGEYEKNSEARVFKNWIVDEFEAPADATFRLGLDFGFAADPSVLVRCYVQGNKLFIDYESYGMHVEINHLPELLAKIPDSKKWLITGDSSRPETISYLRNHGYPQITGASKGAGSIQEGIAFLKSFDIVVHPRCIHTIQELTHYKHKVDKLTGQVLSDFEDMSNHVVDSLRYSTEALRKSNYKAFGGFLIPSL